MIMGGVINFYQEKPTIYLTPNILGDKHNDGY
jgi:hypothetical protein